MTELKASQIKAFREQMLKQQGGRSAISGQIIQEGEAVLDHDHHTGLVRGVITRAENSVLGKVENGRRYGKSFNPILFAKGLHAYLTAPQGPMHPTARALAKKKAAKAPKIV
jgi:hypothetical protein